jgi:multiple sugar transport system permease protein
MSFARAARLALSSAAVLIIAWSFFDVGRRAWNAHRADTDRPITLTVLHWGEPPEDHIVDLLARQYMAEHPNIRVVRVNPGADNFQTKLNTMLAAGTPPDVFYLQPELLPELASMKLIAPLDKQFNAEPAAWRSDFFPLLLDGFRYNPANEHVGAGGTLYGIPKDFTTAVFYVNTDVFKAAGVSVPYEGWTWDQFEADMRKITALSGTTDFADRKIYGGVFEIWPDTLRNLLWTFGGEFFGPGGFRDVALGSPGSQAALQMIYRLQVVEHTMYNLTGIGKDGAAEFFNGNIGCDGPVGRWKCARYRECPFHWDIVPVPHEGTHWASQMFYNAWTMSAASPHPAECWSLMKFLTDRAGQVQAARLGLAIPCLQSVANSPDFLAPPGMPTIHSHLFLDAMAYARIPQIPKQQEWTHIVTDNISRSIQLGLETTRQSAERIQRLWLATLDSPLVQTRWKPMPWKLIITLSIAAFVAICGALWWRIRREPLGVLDRSIERAGWGFVAPWVVGFLVLTLGPIIVSLLLSFSQWAGMTPMGTADAVGLTNYQQLLGHDATFYQSLKVTFWFVVLAVPIGQVASLAVALLMNTKARGIELFRTIYFVPSVVSGVALATMWWQVFNNDYGPLNAMLRPIARFLHTTPPDWFGTDAHRWAVPGFVLMGLWGVGSGMIIYLAGLKGIPPSLYEASTIDGAGPLRRLWNVTLPMLSPLIFYNLVMAIIGSLQVFTQAYVMTRGDGRPDNTTLFYVLNLYRQAFVFHNMGYASAMAWVLFLMVLGLTLLMFRSAKNLVYYEGLRS